MFDEFVKQVRRLFSSKNNAGKLVYKLTDRLHGYKLSLLALSIVLLIGHSQFRAHFYCVGDKNYDAKLLNNFCWINGTTTIYLSNSGGSENLPSQIEVEQDRSLSNVISIIYKLVGTETSDCVTLLHTISTDLLTARLYAETTRRHTIQAPRRTLQSHKS